MIPKLTKNIQLIGIHGRAGSGKDTIANYIAETFSSCYGEPFAGPLKEGAAASFGIDLDDFYDSEAKEKVSPAWGVSPRQIAQFFGTEMFRDTILKLLPNVGNDFWIHRLCKKINGDIDYIEYEEGDTVIITDVRFANEVEFVLANNGIIFHVTRELADGNVGIGGHSSETFDLGFYMSMRSSKEKCQIYPIDNNGTVEELYEAVLNDLTNSHLNFIKQQPL